MDPLNCFLFLYTLNRTPTALLVFLWSYGISYLHYSIETFLLDFHLGLPSPVAETSVQGQMSWNQSKSKKHPSADMGHWHESVCGAFISSGCTPGPRKQIVPSDSWHSVFTIHPWTNAEHIFSVRIPIAQETWESGATVSPAKTRLWPCCKNAGPPSTTLARNQTNNVSNPAVCCVGTAAWVDISALKTRADNKRH